MKLHQFLQGFMPDTPSIWRIRLEDMAFGEPSPDETLLGTLTRLGDAMIWDAKHPNGHKSTNRAIENYNFVVDCLYNNESLPKTAQRRW